VKQREADQFSLFVELVRYNLEEENLQIVRPYFEQRNIKIQSIKNFPHIVPSPDAMIEKISLWDKIPALSLEEKCEQFLKQKKESVLSQIDKYYNELQIEEGDQTEGKDEQESAFVQTFQEIKDMKA